MLQVKLISEVGQKIKQTKEITGGNEIKYGQSSYKKQKFYLRSSLHGKIIRIALKYGLKWS